MGFQKYWKKFEAFHWNISSSINHHISEEWVCNYAYWSKVFPIHSELKFFKDKCYFGTTKGPALKNKSIYKFFFSHIDDYIQASKNSPKQFLILSYEAMKKDPKNEIRQIAKFLNIPLSEERLEDIAKETTFEAMAKNPSTNYEHWDKIGLRDLKESKFMRKGIQKIYTRNKEVYA